MLLLILLITDNDMFNYIITFIRQKQIKMYYSKSER